MDFEISYAEARRGRGGPLGVVYGCELLAHLCLTALALTTVLSLQCHRIEVRFKAREDKISKKSHTTTSYNMASDWEVWRSCCVRRNQLQTSLIRHGRAVRSGLTMGN